MADQHGNDASRDFAQRGASVANDAKNMARGAKKAANFAKKVKNARAAKKAGKAVAKGVSKAASLVSLKIKLYIAAGVFVLLLFIAIINGIPSLAGNSVMHINDPEQIAAGLTVEEFTSINDVDTDKAAFESQNQKVAAILETVLDSAYSAARERLQKEASGNNWYFRAADKTLTPWLDLSESAPLRSEDQIREEIILLTACYSASMTNGVSAEANEHYTDGGTGNGISATADIFTKLNSIAASFYHGDFKRDANGEVSITYVPVYNLTEEEKRAGVTIPDREPDEYMSLVEPIFERADIAAVAQTAFKINFNDPYYPDENVSPTYGDMIISMCNTLAHQLYPEGNWAESKEAVWASCVGRSSCDIVNVALSQVGTSGFSYCWWYGLSCEVPWCAIYVYWCAQQSGVSETVIPRESNCGHYMEYFKSIQRYDSKYAIDTVPPPGTLIFFDWADDGRDGKADHMGIVIGSDGTKVYTVEGNSGYPGQVRTKEYLLVSLDILGYAYPLY